MSKPDDFKKLETFLEAYLHLEWKYAEESIVTDVSEPIIPPTSSELGEIYELVLRGDMRLLKEKVKHIETLGTQYIPFAHRLHSLAKDSRNMQFRF